MFATLGVRSKLYHQWTAEFRRGRNSLEYDPSSAGPATANTDVNVDRVQHMMMDGRLLTINKVTNFISISRDRVENILDNELGMTKVFCSACASSSDTRLK